jgi:hypothetical protein
MIRNAEPKNWKKDKVPVPLRRSKNETRSLAQDKVYKQDKKI